ncbi:hypothetical protein [Yoonia sp. R2-816]
MVDNLDDATTLLELLEQILPDQSIVSAITDGSYGTHNAGA